MKGRLGYRRPSRIAESGKGAQARRIAWYLLGQVLGDFVVDVSSRKLCTTKLLSTACIIKNPFFCSMVSTRTKNDV